MKSRAVPEIGGSQGSRVQLSRVDSGAASGGTEVPGSESAEDESGEPGVLFVTRGPGATNGAIGVHTGQQDSTPMVVFVGQVGNDFAEREAFQEIDYRRMYGPLTKWVGQIDRVERIPEYVSHAFHFFAR